MRFLILAPPGNLQCWYMLPHKSCTRAGKLAQSQAECSLPADSGGFDPRITPHRCSLGRPPIPTHGSAKCVMPMCIGSISTSVWLDLSPAFLVPNQKVIFG